MLFSVASAHPVKKHPMQRVRIKKDTEIMLIIVIFILVYMK